MILLMEHYKTRVCVDDDHLHYEERSLLYTMTSRPFMYIMDVQ